MAGSFIDSSDLEKWVQSIRLDFDSPNVFLLSLSEWLADAPSGAIVAGAATVVAVLALTRRPGMATFIVLAALGVLGAVGWAL